MISKIVNALKANSGVSAWKLNIVETSSSELFYVGRKLETNRASDVTSYEVTLYADKDADGTMQRGSAAFAVYDYMTEEDLARKVADNVYAAGFAMNLWYDLPAPVETKIPESASNIASMSLKDAAEKVSDAVFAADHFENGYLSATEIFLNKVSRRVLNSKGVDVSTASCNGMVELIPSWKEGDEDVEIYHMLRFESLDADKITAQVEEKLNLVHARYEAKNLSEVMDTAAPAKVILQDNEAGRMFRYFSSDLSYGSKYTKSNKFEIGDCVQGTGRITGTKLTLTMASYVQDAFYSAAFDADGVVLADKVLVKDGIAVDRCGSFRMGYYLGEETPSGDLPIIVVEPGEKTFAEMASEPYLRCVVFSGLQVEPNSGYFGGEVRLGFYYDGEKEIPVTGFSISGNFKDAAGTMIYSKEVETTAMYKGPKFLEIRGMSVV